MTDVIKGRSKMFAAIGALLVLFAVSSAFLVHGLTSRGDIEEKRADQAIYTAVQLCEQVRQLGGACVVDPDVLRGATGAQGPQGPGPTDMQVAAAVAVYLRANPPADGRAPTADEIRTAVTAWLAANPPAAGPQGEQGVQGEPGARGPVGPGPTDEQIAAAVAAWLAVNPPPYCPPGSHVEEYKPRLERRVFIVCVKDTKR